MAAQTIVVATLNNGAITVSLTYDDVTLAVASITGVNNDTRTVTATATDDATGKSFAQAMAPGFNQTVAIPKRLSFALVADTTQPAPFPLSQNAWTLTVA